MIKLSERLKLIADQIPKGYSMIDVGTDHGFLPIYLWENKICPKVIMADVSEGSLEKAAENCRELYPEEDFDLRLGDGLKVISCGEADACVIAGMGGILMTKILGEDTVKAKSIKKYILQPRISSGRLRHWLISNGFSITEDLLVEEGKYICNVIGAVSEENRNIHYLQENLEEYKKMDSEDIRLDVPLWLKNEPLAALHIRRRIKSEEAILENVIMGNDSLRKESVRKNIKYLKGLEHEII